jgi:two-component system, OmpR family, flagellar system response regulator FtcR
MIVIVDDREEVKSVFTSWFDAEGIAAAGFSPRDCDTWVRSMTDPEVSAIEAVLLGNCSDRTSLSRAIRLRSSAPLIALNEHKSLDETLGLFAAGFDDVVRKPVHVREILARIQAIRRRLRGVETVVASGGALRICDDGRDPEINGKVLSLPRRERRILEFLARHKGRRVTKAQIYNAVYGLFNEEIEETVIESHISKLRKRLREHMGHDPIDSQRFLGYRLQD